MQYKTINRYIYSIHNNKVMRMASLILLFCIRSHTTYAEDYFSIYSLDKRGMQNIADINDLSAFSKPESALPGSYSVDIFVNNELMGTNLIEFVLDEQKNLIPKLTKQQLIDWGTNPNGSHKLSQMENTQFIDSLPNAIDNASTKFDFNKQKLLINIPQISMKTSAKGLISPDLWEQGITALSLNYSFNGSTIWGSKKNQHSEYLNLRSALNLGSWRLHNYSTYYQSNDIQNWQSINTYAERDVVPLKSQLTIGQTNTLGEVFDSFSFTGIRLESNISMLPSSLRGFAPIVRGVAQDNAKITILQNKSIIYQTYVGAGPFEISDLYPTSSSGNLDVVVEEMNGHKEKFIVPFSSLPIMQRQGQLKYSIEAGKYRAYGSSFHSPNFVQSTFIYGLPWNITTYAGILFAPNYHATTLGSGLSLGEFGAFSFDVTSAKTKFQFNTLSKDSIGQSYRLQYIKSMYQTGTTLTLAGYHYSTKGFYDFSEANDSNLGEMSNNKRSRFQLSINQSLGKDYGSLYFNGYFQDYWGVGRRQSTVNIGYNNNWNKIFYGLNYSFNKTDGNSNDNHFISLNISLPWNFGSHNGNIYSNVNRNNSGAYNSQIGINGSELNNRLNYNVQHSYNNSSNPYTGNISLSYRGSYGTASTGYSYTKQSQRFNYGLSGGFVLHEDGITLAQSVGETIAIIRAPNASNVGVNNYTGITTNDKGYAVIPYLMPYKKNLIKLNVEDLNDNVDLTSNSTKVIPSRGAVVWADFQTRIGWRALIRLTTNNQIIPFGAVVTLQNADLQNSTSKKSEEITGIVGDNGEVYLNSLPESGDLLVQWGKGSNQRCNAHFQLPGNKKLPVLKLTSLCVSG